MDEKTPDQLAEESAMRAAEEVKAESGEADGGENEEVEAEAQNDEEFGDDDLDPAQIEAGIKAKEKALDNAGLLKRFRKVHGRMKEAEKWKADNGTSLERYQMLEKNVKRLTERAAKYPFLDRALETLLAEEEDKAVPDFKYLQEEIAKLLAGAQKATEGTVQSDPLTKELKERLDRLEKEKAEVSQRQAQSELNQRIGSAYQSLPKELAKKQARFKDLPWKNEKWRKEFEGHLDDKALAWSFKNEDKLAKGAMPPFLEFAEQIAGLYLSGGSDVLKRQVMGGDKAKLGLMRSSGPSGNQTRKLPKPGDRDSEDDYLKGLVADVQEEMGSGA